MATIRPYAEVLRPDHVMVKAYEAGLTCGPPGLVLADILQRSGGVWETTVPVCPPMHEDLQELAELTSDEQLRTMAELSEVRVPLGHLRHLEPQTRIVLGFRLDYTDAERQWLSSKSGRADRGIACLLGDYVIPGSESDLARKDLLSSRSLGIVVLTMAMSGRGVPRERANGFANNRPGRARISLDRRTGYGRRKQVRPMITDDPRDP